MGEGGIGEGKDSIDARLELALSEPAVDVEGGGALFVGSGREHHEAADRAALDVERAHRKGGAGVATGHEDEATACGEGGSSAVEVRFAGGFPPNVHPGRGDLFEFGEHILSGVIEGGFGTQITAGLNFRVGAGGAEHAGAQGASQLNDGGANASAASVDEKRFAAEQLGFAHEAEMRGDRNERGSGGLFIGHSIGQRIRPGFIDGDLFRESALSAEQTLIAAPDSIPDLEEAHLRPDGFDDTGEVASDDEGFGEIDRDEARSDVGVDGIDGDGARVDEQLIRLGDGGWQVAELDGFGGTCALEERGLHGAGPWMTCRGTATGFPGAIAGSHWEGWAGRMAVMNREAWLMFLGLAVASAVGVLGFAAWKKNQELGTVQLQLEEVRKAADQRGAHLAEAAHALDLERKRAAALAQEFSTVTNTQQRLESEMRAALQSRDIAISELQGKLTVNILDRILFDSGEATLKAEGTHVLDQVAKVLARFESRQVQVFGHTDNIPIRLKFPSNWELSTARAVSAVRYLTEKAGVDPRRLSAVGCGEFQPIADNATGEGRAKNRRIALVVLPEQFAPTDVDRSDTNAASAIPPIPLESSTARKAVQTNAPPTDVEGGADLPLAPTTNEIPATVEPAGAAIVAPTP